MAIPLFVLFILNRFSDNSICFRGNEILSIGYCYKKQSDLRYQKPVNTATVQTKTKNRHVLKVPHQNCVHRP